MFHYEYVSGNLKYSLYKSDGTYEGANTTSNPEIAGNYVKISAGYGGSGKRYRDITILKPCKLTLYRIYYDVWNETLADGIDVSAGQTYTIDNGVCTGVMLIAEK